MSFRPGQPVIVHDRRHDRRHRGVVTHVLDNDVSDTAGATTVHLVRWVDESGRPQHTHRYADELSAVVLSDRARLVWQARRAGARLVEDITPRSVRIRRWEGPGIHLTILGDER